MTRTPTISTTGVVIAGRRVAMLDRARIYVCGITPYDVTHLGHAATFVWADTLGRVLRFVGVEPDVCRNVTDVDDVLDAAAHQVRADYDTIAAIQHLYFDRDMAALSVRSPQHEPYAHRYVGQVIRLASGLLEAGAAYASGGSVYFRGRGVAGRAGLDQAGAAALSAEYGAGRGIRPRPIRSMLRCGRRASPVIRPGIPRGARAGLAGTPDVPRWPCPSSAPAWTFTSGGRICGSPITPTMRR